MKQKARNVALVLVIAAAMALPVAGIIASVEEVEAAPPETVLRIGSLQSIDSLNPYIGLNDISYVLYGLVYDALVGIGNDLEPVPNLATSWHAVPESDPLMIISGEPYGSVWQYNLTHSATWTDGTPFTADDVVFNINLNADNYNSMWAFQPYSFFMDYAEKIDGYTVRIHYWDRVTGTPIPVAYGGMIHIPILPKHLLETLDPFYIGFNWTGIFPYEDPPLVGTGPFMATSDIYNEWLTGDHITLAKRPDYHWTVDGTAEVHFDKLVIYFFDDPTAMRFALQTNQIDVAEFPPQYFRALEWDIDTGTMTNVTAFSGPKPTQYFEHVLVNMNNGGPNPSRLDPIIRQALAMATDKSYIVDNFYFGLAEEGSTLIPAVNSLWHYEPNASERIEYNLTKANEILEAAGYVDGPDADTVRECTASSWAVQEGLVPEGKPLTYEIIVQREHPEERDMAMFLQDEFSKIGVRLNYLIVDEAFLATMVYSYEYDTAIWYRSADVDPNYILFTQSRNAWNGWSDTKYSNPAYEENYSLSVMTLDPVQRKVFVDNCQRIHYTDAPYIIFAYVNQTYAWRTDMFSGWGDWAADPGRSIDASWTGNPLYFDLIPIVSTNSPPFDVQIDPDADRALVGSPVTITATATDSDADRISFHVQFGDGDSETIVHAIGGTSPQSVDFIHTYGAAGTYLITLWADDLTGIDGHNVTITATIMIIESGDRTVEYRWYDMFNVPFGEWWYRRWEAYRMEEPLTDSYPYILKRYGSPSGDISFLSGMKLDITGRNMSELNMTSRPEFLPFLGTERGGNATIDWYMQYLTGDEIANRTGMNYSWNDGWIVSLNGTLRLDKQAAKAVLNLTDAGYDDFATWWGANESVVESNYTDWLETEAGPDRLDIYPMYDWFLTLMRFDIFAQRVGDLIVLNYDIVGWGMEVLMARWLHEAFLPNEWFYEGMNLHAAMGPERGDLDISTAVPYAVQAWETGFAPGGTPCWIWEGMLGDYIPSSIIHPNSTFDPYQDKNHLELSPGNAFYGLMVPLYDYTPGAFNLSKGEMLSFEWPSGEQQFKVHVGPGSVANMSANMTVDYSEPIDADVPGQVVTDPVARTLTFVGPIDMWTWSKDQRTHDNLADEWARLGMLLPRGAPYIEFRASAPSTDLPPVADAGSDQVVMGGVPVVLDGSRSHDDGVTMNYTWTFMYEGSLTTLYGVNPEFTFWTEGVYEVTLTVRDSAGQTDTDWVIVTVSGMIPEFSGLLVPVLGAAAAVLAVLRRRTRQRTS